eukprot:TRINITY_DN12263_c0_g1_i2.p1 TRINITY_DN12263_c0_g1~~TRINITY_DN12263_c0_g1_i2.p1  ORF type:complete len:423 (-),score=64.48 TRINITY_DN12263_c0_g1_i2:1221-2489(-)
MIYPNAAEASLHVEIPCGSEDTQDSTNDAPLPRGQDQQPPAESMACMRDPHLKRQSPWGRALVLCGLRLLSKHLPEPRAQAVWSWRLNMSRALPSIFSLLGDQEQILADSLAHSASACAPTILWEWQASNLQWITHEPAACAQIEVALRRKRDQFALTAPGRKRDTGPTYLVWVSGRTQIDVATGQSFNLRRRKPVVTHLTVPPEDDYQVTSTSKPLSEQGEGRDITAKERVLLRKQHAKLEARRKHEEDLLVARLSSREHHAVCDQRKEVLYGNAPSSAWTIPTSATEGPSGPAVEHEEGSLFSAEETEMSADFILSNVSAQEDDIGIDDLHQILAVGGDGGDMDVNAPVSPAPCESAELEPRRERTSSNCSENSIDGLEPVAHIACTDETLSSESVFIPLRSQAPKLKLPFQMKAYTEKR